jgi:hypothetical protein
MIEPEPSKSAIASIAPHRLRARDAWLVLLVFWGALYAGIARGDPKAPATALAAPKVLNDGEMDTVTAGGIALRLDLAASASGGTAFTNARGEARIVRATMLKIATVPGAPPQAQARLLGEQAADIAIGTGHATASGDGAAGCSARAEALGDIAFIRGLASAATTPTAATCLCAIFAIAPVK